MEKKYTKRDEYNELVLLTNSLTTNEKDNLNDAVSVLGKEYQGNNALILMIDMINNNRTTNAYGTFKQLQKLGINLVNAKGKSIPLRLPCKTTELDENGNELTTGLYFKLFYVFNLDDTDATAEIKAEFNTAFKQEQQTQQEEPTSVPLAIINRIKCILTKAKDSAVENAESSVFLKKAKELMEKYNITIDYIKKIDKDFNITV